MLDTNIKITVKQEERNCQTIYLKDYSSYEDLRLDLQQSFGFDLADDEEDDNFSIVNIEGIKGLSLMDQELIKTKWNVKDFFEILDESSVLFDDGAFYTMCAYVEARDWDAFVELVNSHGSKWDRDITFYKGKTPKEVCEDNWDWEIDETLAKLGLWFACYIKIDYEQMARDDATLTETEDGTIQIND